MIKITYLDPEDNKFTITPLWISHVPAGTDEESGEGAGTGHVAVKKKIDEKEFKDLVNSCRMLLRNTDLHLDEREEDSVTLKFENDDDQTTYILREADEQLTFEEQFYYILDQ